MLVLGLLAAAFLGLMALRGIAMLFVPASPDPFLFPLQIAIPVALAFGMAVTYILGQLLGLFGMRTLRDYEARRRISREVLRIAEERAAVPEATIEY